MVSPLAMSVKVFVEECSVSVPIVIAASWPPLTTVAPPSRSEPSALVSVNAYAAPEAEEVTWSR